VLGSLGVTGSSRVTGSLSVPTLSNATAQRSLTVRERTYPLFPPLTSGDPKETSATPLELVFDYSKVDAELFNQAPLPGLERWSPLLPPLLPGLSLGEGDTPLIEAPVVANWASTSARVFLKDESRNPTWSHKDRLNLCTVSAAVLSQAPGIIVTSSGNHAASAASYAARANLPCVVFVRPSAAPALRSLIAATGAAVLEVQGDPIPVMKDFAARTGFQAVSSVTMPHTGHPFGTEGYKTIAYELFLQLGRTLPSAVFVPTGYGELLYGIYKGFWEMQHLGLTTSLPRLFACEPAARAPLARALEQSLPTTEVEAKPTLQYATGVTWNSYRGVLAVKGSDGKAVRVSDESALEAQRVLGRQGMWQELSAVSGVAGLRDCVQNGETLSGAIVCVTCSSGFKDSGLGSVTLPSAEASLGAVRHALQTAYPEHEVLQQHLQTL
jgi:threonine synthase